MSEKKMYRLSEYKTYTRYHYVWAENEQEAENLFFGKYAAVVDNTEFYLEFNNCEIAEEDSPDLVEKDWPGYILNGDIEDWCEDKDGDQ